MRLAKLELLAYGPFRGRVLDFSAPGIHVVYGRNEAGKSTTLRAILGLLYGIEPKTQDAHVHRGADLRIGGVLEDAAGERTRIVRRKGNANTLLEDARESPGKERVLDEHVVRRFLGGVSRETFRHAFGLDHETLEAGARALLEGKGDLGESLFDASVGGGGEVQRLVAELEQEADRLFKPRGSSLPLNDALKAFAEAQKSVRERQSLPEAFTTQVEGLERATEDREARRREKAALYAAKARFERVRRRVPDERKRASLLERRRELGALFEHAARALALKERFSAYERALEERRTNLAEAERIADRVAVAARHAGVALETHAGEPADLAALRLDARREARIEDLLRERSDLLVALEAAKRHDARGARELRSLEEESGASKAVDPAAMVRLVGALERARALGDIEARIATEESRLSRKKGDLERRVAALGIWPGAMNASPDLDAFAALRLPPAASVDRLVARADAADRVLARLRDRAAELTRDRASIARQIAAQSGDYAPPDAAELRAARASRDEAWRAARAANEPLLRRAGDLEVERLLREADAVADRMIREADRVTSLARLRSEAEAQAQDEAQVTTEIASAEAERASVLAELAALFAPAAIDPPGLGEMSHFLVQHRQLTEAYAGVVEAARAVAVEADRAAAARSELVTALGASGERSQEEGSKARLVDVVAVGARHLAALEAAARVATEAARLRAGREELATARAEQERRLAEVSAALAALTGPLGVAADASAAEVTRSLSALRELFATLDSRSQVEARARRAGSEARAFEEALTLAVRELAPELAGLEPAMAARELFGRAAQAQDLARELAEVEARLEESAGIEPTDAERDLVADPERASAHERELGERLEEVERELSAVEQRIGSIGAGLDRMRAESNAAEFAATAQQELARIRDTAERWCRARLARVILQREIERYREENQGPLLAAASALFARLTLGAYAGVRAGFDDKDRPCLRCVRAEPHLEVDVSGLSDGTRDQLYLSLRLASLLRRAEVAEPMPLILDDVLIQLDDARAAAALGVLAEVAKKLQVLFFTHHARLVELARTAVASDSLVVHELAPASVAPDAAAELRTPPA